VSLRPIVVEMADCKVSNDPETVLITYALGSCIGLAVYDPVVRAGGLLHFMLPDSRVDMGKACENPYRFADRGIPALLEEMGRFGADKRRLQVVAVGAAELIDGSLFQIGKRNRAALHRIFWREGILISAEAVGGRTARTLRLEIGSGRFLCRVAGEREQEIPIAPNLGV
jgi:chemotaxis protein CheD